MVSRRQKPAIVFSGAIPRWGDRPRRRRLDPGAGLWAWRGSQCGRAVGAARLLERDAACLIGPLQDVLKPDIQPR